MEIADTCFFVIPDEEKQTLTIGPTEEKYGVIRLNKVKAQLLADIILRQIQKW